ncbi:MAG: hypothetical protein FE78DRAFT_31119 [Acidomyces sp. 'richmondensis']|nr:MAG: hypothetical protein FE78DRAFT_31119 [Acidomyces sp. 'richmondensis']
MIPIADVIYVLGIGFNLLSIAQLIARGIICEFAGDIAILSREGKIVATSTRKDMTYILIVRASGSENERRSLLKKQLQTEQLKELREVCSILTTARYVKQQRARR